MTTLQRRFERALARRMGTGGTTRVMNLAPRRSKKARRVVVVETHKEKMAKRKQRRAERFSSVNHAAALGRNIHLRAIRARERNFLDELQR